MEIGGKRNYVPENNKTEKFKDETLEETLDRLEKEEKEEQQRLANKEKGIKGDSAIERLEAKIKETEQQQQQRDELAALLRHNATVEQFGNSNSNSNSNGNSNSGSSDISPTSPAGSSTAREDELIHELFRQRQELGGSVEGSGPAAASREDVHRVRKTVVIRRKRASALGIRKRT